MLQKIDLIFSSPTTNKRLRVVIFVILGCFALYPLLFGIGTMGDAIRGFEVLFQSKEGAEWNTLHYTLGEETHSFFVAWWSPAQWMIPKGLSVIFGTHFQLIQSVLAICLSGLGLYFYYLLFRKLKFSKTIALLSILLIVCNQAFYWHFFLYYGGDLLVLFFLPLYLLFVIRLKEKFSVQNVIFFLFLTGIGIFFKNTFLIYFCASLSYLFFSNQLYQIKQWKKTFVLGGVFLLIIGAAFYFFLQHGETPSSAVEPGTYRDVPNTYWGDVLYPLGSPAGVITRISPVFQKAIQWGVNQELILFLSQLFVFGITFFLFRFIYLQKKKYNEFFHLAFFFVIPIFCVFIYFYLQDKAISYEMRHFAPISFLFVPGFIQFIQQPVHLKKWLFLGFFGISLLDLGGFFFTGYRLQQNRTKVGEFLVMNEEAELLKAVKNWDDKHSNSLLLVEDYWLPLWGGKNNDKICLYKENEEWKVNSGIELNETPSVNFETINWQQYRSFLVIRPKGSEVLKNDFTPFVSSKKVVHSFETERYVVEVME